MKLGRIDYSKDINFIEASKSLYSLNCLFRIEKSILVSILYPLYNLIITVQDNAKLGRKYAKAHDEMAELLDHFWGHREVIDVNYQSNIKISELLLESLKYINDIDFSSYLVSLIRIPEFYYLSHEELSDIQSKPMENLDKVSMLSNNKSIFKIPGKELSLEDIVDLNSIYIKEHCGEYQDDMASKFRDYLNNEKFVNKEVAYFMKRWKSQLSQEFDKVMSGEKLVFCHKTSSNFYPGSKSIIEDNFWTYESKVVPKELEEGFHQYDRIPLQENFDYLKLAFGLGPDFKLRNIVFTNTMLQNIGSIVRDSAKKAFMDQEKMYLSPIRTDAQLERFHKFLEKPIKGCKICFDLSKYSDYLLSQMVDLLIDYLSPNKLYSDCLKKIQNLPIKIGNKMVKIVFGTGAGIKSNFDLITALNMLMIDFTSYRTEIDYQELEVVGDDLFAVSQELLFQKELITTYTHFNCKVNLKKARIINESGKISFCNRHFWINGDTITSWNGLPPGLWIKEIYSMNRIHSIARILIETKQTYKIDRMEDLKELSRSSIEREFKYNKMTLDLDLIFDRMRIIPYDINGLNPDSEFNYDLHYEWIEDIFNTLDNYIFMMKNNSKVKEMMSKYYDMFPDHPIIQSFLFTNGKYLEILNGITESYDKLKVMKDENSYQDFKRWIKRAIMEFGKFDQGSLRISTKDRTSDYFNEDLFWKDPIKHVPEYIHRFDQLEIEVLKSVESDYPVAEMYLIMKSKRLIRNAYNYVYGSGGVYMDLPSGRIARFVTSDSRPYNGRYHDSLYVASEVFDLIYPNSGESWDHKQKAINDLEKFIKSLWKTGNKRVEEMMGFFES